MSDLYSIQSSTLVDIGDALRRRHGDTKTIIVKDDKPLKIISKTDNATGFDSHNGDYAANLKLYDVVKMPGAARIEVKLSCQTESAFYDYLQVAAGELNSTNFPAAEKYGGKTIQNVELTFNTDAITFRFISDSSNSSYLGYYAECVGYDADGNACIGDVEKEIPNTYSSADMAAAIDAIEVGVVPPDTILHLTGNCSNKFKDGVLDWVIEACGDIMTTYDLTSTETMFSNSQIERIPFSLNYKNSTSNSTSQTFAAVSRLKELPAVNGIMGNMYNYLGRCISVNSIPESWVDTMDFSTVINPAASWYYCRLSCFFSNCYSLRIIPEAFLKKLWNKCNATNAWGEMFNCCYVLDEIVGLRGPSAAATSNLFNSNFTSCYRLKRLVFDMENGTPRAENWQNQIIDLSSNVGYSTSGNKVMITSYNSGITADKEVSDDATYQALKNDSDWFTANVAYSRYNHDSAVETINSLPDCSASGGTNTIKFTGAAGSSTDGGAINTLTEEEIAVATAKGWTVSLV
jgi:hypothetical protein